MRVLLVDDREVAEHLRRELEDESFHAVVGRDGASGLRLAETSAFDILVLDVMMPFLDGLQVTLGFTVCFPPANRRCGSTLLN